MVATLKGQYGSGIREAVSYLGQNYMVVEPSIVSELLQILRDREQFDYCVDVTAVHYPEREKQFDVVWILYSFAQKRTHSREDDDRRRRNRAQCGFDLGDGELAGARGL